MVAKGHCNQRIELTRLIKQSMGGLHTSAIYSPRRDDVTILSHTTACLSEHFWPEATALAIEVGNACVIVDEGEERRCPLPSTAKTGQLVVFEFVPAASVVWPPMMLTSREVHTKLNKLCMAIDLRMGGDSLEHAKKLLEKADGLDRITYIFKHFLPCDDTAERMEKRRDWLEDEPQYKRLSRFSS